jgi:hypothetical protein
MAGSVERFSPRTVRGLVSAISFWKSPFERNHQSLILYQPTSHLMATQEQLPSSANALRSKFGEAEGICALDLKLSQEAVRDDP